MIKRLVLVLTLLFAQTTFAQNITSGQNNAGSVTSERPVVTSSATGVVSLSDNSASTTASVTPSANLITTLSPAEAVASSSSTSSPSVTQTGIGAVGTSSTSTVTTSSPTVDVASTTEPIIEDGDGIFDIVYGGFEEFVEKFFGWE